MQNGVAYLFRQFTPWGGQVELQVVGQRFQPVPVMDFLAGALATGPRRDGASGDGQAVVGDDQLRIEALQVAEAAAFGAGAERGVEREHPWLELLRGGAMFSSV